MVRYLPHDVRQESILHFLPGPGPGVRFPREQLHLMFDELGLLIVEDFLEEVGVLGILHRIYCTNWRQSESLAKARQQQIHWKILHS